MTLAQLHKLQTIYQGLPRLQCQQKCQECCGPIAMTAVEQRRLESRYGGALPVLTSVKALCDITGQPIPDLGENVPIIGRQDTNLCPLLTPDGMCGAYAFRPLICRLWGIVETMVCPHGCKPEPRYLTAQEGYEVLAKVARLSRGYK